jgi:2-methylcitrate dehydratase PrpD
MSAPGLTRALAARSATLTAADLPDDVMEISRQALLDWFGVALGGCREPAPEIVLGAIGGADSGPATLVGRGTRHSAIVAATVNGTASHVLDFDDVNMVAIAHVSAAVLPAALALAEELDLDAQALLVGYVAGYETVGRVGAAIGPEPYLRGHHATGTLGVFGAAAACARLLGLDTDRTAVALGLAATQAAALKCHFGTMAKPLHAGRAAGAGLLAARLAAGGFTASDSAIEAEQGFAALAGGGCDEAAALADPPSGWHVRDNLFKHHASCFLTHSMLEGLAELLDGRPVERVVVHISELERGTCAIAAPASGLEAKFSLAHLAAMALCGRSTAVVVDDDAHDRELLAARELVVLDDDGVAGEPTRVDLLFSDGTSRSAAVDVNTPDRDLARQSARLAEKFDRLASPVLGEEGAQRLRASLVAAGPETSVAGLMGLVAGGVLRAE